MIETETDRKRDRQKDTQRERHREGDRDTERETHRHTQRQRDRGKTEGKKDKMKNLKQTSWMWCQYSWNPRSQGQVEGSGTQSQIHPSRSQAGIRGVFFTSKERTCNGLTRKWFSGV